MMNITAIDFRPFRKNTLRGFAIIEIAELHLRMRDVAIHQQGGSRWAALPARAQIDRDGNLIRDDRGKIAYVAIFEFADPGTRNAFSQAVIAAIERFNPEIFATLGALASGE
jgi:hypothetical protein